MPLKLKAFLFSAGLIFLCSCNNNSSETKASGDTTVSETPKTLVENVLTADGQKALTSDAVLQQLKDGNNRFMNNNLTPRNYSAQVKNSADGQFPKAAVISCLDSRVPVEEIFDQGIGDLFVGRVAGNFVNGDLLGSLEYSCKVSGAKLIVVMGHKSCGAVKSAIDNVQLGNITEMLAKIKPAVDSSKNFTGEKSSKNDEYVTYVAKNNVKHTIEVIRTKSPILKEMEDKGEIKIVGAYYDLNTGQVTFL